MTLIIRQKRPGKGIDAGLAAGIFHQKLLTIRELKEYLNENGVEMRL